MMLLGLFRFSHLKLGTERYREDFKQELRLENRFQIYICHIHVHIESGHS